MGKCLHPCLSVCLSVCLAPSRSPCLRPQLPVSWGGPKGAGSTADRQCLVAQPPASPPQPTSAHLSPPRTADTFSRSHLFRLLNPLRLRLARKRCASHSLLLGHFPFPLRSSGRVGPGHGPGHGPPGHGPPGQILNKHNQQQAEPGLGCTNRCLSPVCNRVLTGTSLQTKQVASGARKLVAV